MSSNICRVCGETIMQMCRKNTGLCGEICQKVDEQPKIETHTTDEVREMHGFELHSYGPSYHGLGTIDVVQPSPDVDPEIKRPSVPSLLGWLAAEQLEAAGELMEGDIRRGPHDKFDVWSNGVWKPCEKPEKVA